MGIFHPKPAAPAFGEGKVIPERKALYVVGACVLPINLIFLHSFISQIFFAWLDPLLRVGYTRPLEQEGQLHNVLTLSISTNHHIKDLWDLPSDRLTTVLTDRVESAFFARCPPEQRPSAFRETPHDTDSEVDVDVKHEDEQRAEGGVKGEKTEEKQIYDASILKALHSVFYAQWWFAGLLQLCAGTFLLDRNAMET